jgi:gamma-glutamyltranspeptidase/glutathione hydrolase
MILMFRFWHLSLLTCVVAQSTFSAEAIDPHQMIATVNPIATDAGIVTFEGGGNAVDAAVAAALMLGVVDGHNSGIGGGCFILIRTAEGKLIAIDGRERAPGKATRDMYVADGKAQPELSRTGTLAVATPGALAAYAEAVKKFGQVPISKSLILAARCAESGFEIDELFAKRLADTADDIRKFPATAEVFFDKDGKPLRTGTRLKQRDLARSYRQIAEQGTDWFYRGEFAEKTAKLMSESGGILNIEDFAKYEIARREPIQTTYRDLEIIGFPPPSSGGVHVSQILNMLESFDLEELRKEDPATFTHVVAEAMKLAFADRAHWLGDPEFADVPRGLLNKDYAAKLATQIKLDQATEVKSHGQPPKAKVHLFGGALKPIRLPVEDANSGEQSSSDTILKCPLEHPEEFLVERHTTHIAAADSEGNWVAITTTLNTSFGSKVMVPGTGILLNNQMDDFSAQPGVPNAFGLVGAEANAIEPYKRPLSSMSPTIVLKDSQPILTLGAAGGPRIISQVLLSIINRVDLQQPLPAAIGQKRFHHQWSPDVLFVETGTPESWIKNLESRGHSVKTLDYMGFTQGTVAC